MSTGAVEIFCAWGGDWELDDTGDLLLAQDVLSNPIATQQRLTRLVLSCSNLKDAQGNVVAYADDIFHPTLGGNAPAYVGTNVTTSNTTQMTARITQELIGDPSVAATPPPVVTFAVIAPNTTQLNVTYTDMSGQKQVLPTITLSPSGATVGPAPMIT